jgi:hypothetical protein
VPLAVKEALEAEASASPGDAPPAALRLPLACGPPRAARDAEGAAATVLDVVYAADVLAAAATDVRLKAFLIGTALSHAGAKHGWALDAKYKLPRRRYMDEPVRAQRVRADGAGGAAPLICELPAEAPSGGGAAAAAGAAAEAPSFPLRVAPAAPRPAPAAAAAGAKPAAQRPAAGIPAAAAAAAAAAGGAPAAAEGAYSLSFEGRPCAALLVRVPLPAAAARDNGALLRATLRRGELTVEAPPAAAPLAAVPLPFECDARTATAWLEPAGPSDAPARVTLCARLPVLPYADVAAAAARAASAAKGALDLSAAAYLELID